MKKQTEADPQLTAEQRLLFAQAAKAESLVEQARKRAHLAKVQFKKARKILKQAKKQAKQARKQVKAAAKSLMNGKVKADAKRKNAARKLVVRPPRRKARNIPENSETASLHPADSGKA